jgi:8-oxo-dGTP pyrophosphatase MutT (NUDIX family)
MYRDRAEVFAVDPLGRLFGGVWKEDQSFAVPGGGVDLGESPLQAAIREYAEETGYRIANPRLSGVEPVVNQWSEAHRAKLPADRRHFLGSRTHFVLADLLDRQKSEELDHWSADQQRLYNIAEALELMRDKKFMAPQIADARLRVLQELAGSTKTQTKQAGIGLHRLVGFLLAVGNASRRGNLS